MTSSKLKNKTYTLKFKEETVTLVTDQGYLVKEATGARLTGAGSPRRQ